MIYMVVTVACMHSCKKHACVKASECYKAKADAWTQAKLLATVL